MKDLGFWISFYRADHAVFVFIAVLVAFYFSSSSFSLEHIFYAIPPFFITLGAFAHNDIVDKKADLINRRERPLKDKEVSSLVYVIPYALAITSALFLGLKVFLFILFFFLVSFFYNEFLKGLPLVGNLAISLSMAAPFAYAIFIEGFSEFNYYAFLFSFLVGVGREIVKDVEDVEGDRALGRKTLPILLGKEKSLYLSSFILVFVSIYFFITFFEFSLVGLFVLLTSLLIIYSVYLSFHSLRLARVFLYISMIVGFISLVIEFGF